MKTLTIDGGLGWMKKSLGAISVSDKRAFQKLQRDALNQAIRFVLLLHENQEWFEATKVSCPSTQCANLLDASSRIEIMSQALEPSVLKLRDVDKHIKSHAKTRGTRTLLTEKAFLREMLKILARGVEEAESLVSLLGALALKNRFRRPRKNAVRG